MSLRVLPNSPGGPATTRTICRENIGPGERRKRIRFGAVTLAVGLAVAAILVVTGAGRWWRIGLFLPFASAAIGFFQAFEKT